MNNISECLNVVIRCRPLNEAERLDGRTSIVNMDTKNGQVLVHNPYELNEVPKQFAFDQIFDGQSQQEQLYNATTIPIIESVLEGYNCTIYAYGQTETGMTYTMEGEDQPEQRGIIPRTFDHIFKRIENMAQDKEFLVKVSYFDLCKNEIRDLLSNDLKNKFEILQKTDGDGEVYVKNLSQFSIKNSIEMSEKWFDGNSNRYSRNAEIDQQFTRSHSFFQIIIESKEINQNSSHIKVGKLYFVDLAGRGFKSKEGFDFDQSLRTLANVMWSLVDKKSKHIPYRDSKLTRLLQDSFGGNTKTVMIANIGPADSNYDETLKTLRLASIAKQIKNEPKINEVPKNPQIRLLYEEVVSLKSQLQTDDGFVNVSYNSQIFLQQVEKIQILDEIQEAGMPIRQFENENGEDKFE